MSRVGKRMLAAAALLGGGLLAVRPARACSCGVDAAIYPTDGEVDVPLNAGLVVQEGGGIGPVELQRTDGSPVVTERVALSVRYLYFYRPATDVEPDTEYVMRDGDRELGRFVTGTGLDFEPPKHQMCRSLPSPTPSQTAARPATHFTRAHPHRSRACGRRRHDVRGTHLLGRNDTAGSASTG